MPRAGWLAMGGLLAAVGVGSVADIAPTDEVAVVAVIIAVAISGAGMAALARRPRSALLALGSLSVGVRLAASLMLGSVAQDPGPLPAGNGSWQATVVRLGSTDGGLQRALLSVEPSQDASVQVSAPGPWPVYAWLPRYPIIFSNDRITFSGVLEAAPEGPGFGDALRSLGAQASVRPDSVSVTPVDRGLLGKVEPIRRAAGDRLFAVLPQREAGLAAGILVGLRELVDRGVAADFTTSGLSHVVAISGWNIAQVGAVIVSLLRWMPRRARSFIVIAAIVMYTLLAGGSASVVRAAVMGAVALLARETGRRGGAATALGLAVWLLLLADPAMATDVGFQLSVAATAGLLAWAAPLQERFGARAWRWVPGWLVETLAVSTAAQAATLPLVLLHFGRLSLVSPLANLVAAPLIAPVMLLSLVGLIAGVVVALGVPALLLAPAVLASWAGLAALIAIAQANAALPFASVTLAPPLDLIGGSLAAMGVFLVGTRLGRTVLQCAVRLARKAAWGGVAGKATPRPRRPGVSLRAAAAGYGQPGMAAPRPKSTGAVPHGSRPHTRRLATVAGAAAAAFILASAALVAARPDGRLRITVLDVGQGDAILMEGNRGARVLIDGGPDPDVLQRRLDEHIPSWDRRLDLLVLTHPHEDHVAGMPLLLQRYRVATVVDTGMLGNGPGDRAFRSQLQSLGVQTVNLFEGDHLQVDDASASVLWPRAGEVPLHPANGGSAVNDVSIVLDIRFGQRRFLLTGDVEQEIDPELLAERIGGDDQPRVDLLKVAHHGSRTASTDPFLRAVQPRVAFVSAGAGNPYGHPAPGTIQRLRDAGAEVYRTDTDGDLMASSDGTDLHTSTSGRHASPAARAPQPTATAAVAALGFSCAIPRPEVVVAGASAPSWVAAAGSSVRTTHHDAAHLHVRQHLVAQGRDSTGSHAPPGMPCYDRSDERALARQGRRRPARAAASASTASPHDRRGRGRGLPRYAHVRRRNAGRPETGDDGGAAP